MCMSAQLTFISYQYISCIDWLILVLVLFQSLLILVQSFVSITDVVHVMLQYYIHLDVTAYCT